MKEETQESRVQIPLGPHATVVIMATYLSCNFTQNVSVAQKVNRRSRVQISPVAFRGEV